MCIWSFKVELEASVRKQLGLQTMKGSKSARSHTLAIRESRKGRTGSEYNKWYIDPKLRYMKKEENPKNNIRAYADQQYIYKNLHNQVFWDWEHPFDKNNKV